MPPYIDRMNRPKPAGKRVRVILLTQVIGPLDYRLPDSDGLSVLKKMI